MPSFAAALAVIHETHYEFGRIHGPGDWILPLVALIAILAFVVWMYRRDTVEVGRATSLLLVALRSLAFIGLLFVFLRPQWRHDITERENSRVLLLVDTSLSMDSPADTSVADAPTDAQQVIAAISGTRLLDRLRAENELTILRFDVDSSRLASFARLPATESGELPAVAPDDDPRRAVDWQQALAPRGVETRLGEALRRVLYEEQSQSLSGIIVVTDGGQNSGADLSEAMRIAKRAGIPVFPVGMGSDQQPHNVAVKALNVPARVHPGDRFKISGALRSVGMPGRTVRIELHTRPLGGAKAVAGQATGRLVEFRELTLGDDSAETPFEFETAPAELGRQLYSLRVVAPADDGNRFDNLREAAVEIVDRKTRVLLFAGGPSRDYQFLQRQLNRDKEMNVDVLLQSGDEGISQDAQRVLDEFPRLRQELFAYDCIVAFDPDWRKLSIRQPGATEPSQVEMVEDWVGKQAGGLIFVAGPVNMDLWTHVPGLAPIRNLYPVEFNRRFASLEDARYGAAEPWPLELTREGQEASYLRLVDGAAASTAAWGDFPGVYGYYAVRGEKPAATVLARFSNPAAAVSGKLPPYVVAQSYGAGQVVFMASGEMYRLRAIDEGYFERLYTQLVRHVAQGRMRRGSARGLLEIDEHDQTLPGDTIDIRARLTDAQFRPLTQPQVVVQVLTPVGTLEQAPLTLEADRPGSYRGQYTVRREGSYQLELPVPDSAEPPLTTPPVQVTVPNLERDNRRRNDALLVQLAKETQGTGYRYFSGAEALRDLDGPASLPAQFPDRGRERVVPQTVVSLWDNYWTLCFICGVLCLEWLTRRLVKLA